MRRSLSSSLLAVLVAATCAQAQPVPDWLADWARTEGLPLPTPRPTSPAPPPSPYDDASYFTDADELEAPPGVRLHLDRALRPDASASDIRAVPWHLVNGASTVEKARLVERAAAVGASDWIAALFDHFRPTGSPLGSFSDRGFDGVVRPRATEGARTLEALCRRGSLLRVSQAAGDALLRALPRHVATADVARALVPALLFQDTRPRRLAAHRVLDEARARGWLAPVLEGLRASPNAAVRAIASQASPTRRPEVIAHRADPIAAAENTLPAIQSAADRGADGVEIDLCITKDGRIVLWHDAAPGSLISVVRNLGLEGGMSYRPTWPEVGSPFRRPVKELTLAEVRRHLGYAGKDGAPLPGSAYTIPTWEEAAALLAGLPSLRRIVLDIKLPGEAPQLAARFAQALLPALDRHGLRPRVVCMTIEASVVTALKPLLGEGVRFTHDIEITNAIVPGGGHSAVKAAQRLGNSVCSVGRPRVPKLGGEYDYFLGVLRADRARIDQGGLGLRLLTWTLNDELELREVIAIGVDGIITDDPTLLLDLRRRLGL